jgi:hypothetical protein
MTITQERLIRRALEAEGGWCEYIPAERKAVASLHYRGLVDVLEWGSLYRIHRPESQDLTQ